MKPVGKMLVLFCVLAVSLLLPTGSASGSNVVAFSEGSYAEAHLTGTHGYRIMIFATNQVLLVIARKGTASVNYSLLKDGLKGNRIHARLPGVGRVFLNFHGRGHPHGRPVTDCRGPATLARKGVFVGTVKIRGERGYTNAVSHHLRGEIVQEGHAGCHRRPGSRASGAASRLLSASTDRGSGRLSFTVFNLPSTKLGSDLLFGASLARLRGQMVITTTQSALGKDPAALEIATPPRSASVDPPPPFSGSADFQQEAANQFSWSGDLAVELPGVGEVSLAGPKFETSVCVGPRCRGDRDETEGNSTIVQILS